MKDVLTRPAVFGTTGACLALVSIALDLLRVLYFTVFRPHEPNMALSLSTNNLLSGVGLATALLGLGLGVAGLVLREDRRERAGIAVGVGAMWVMGVIAQLGFSFLGYFG